ncbi:hypothetical protein SprV_0401405700 [Sparganum proliferum]
MGRDLRIGVISSYRCHVLGDSRSEQSPSFSDVVALSATAPDPATTIFVTDDDIKECQLVIFFLLHRKLYVREDAVETFFNSNHPISHKRSCVKTLYRRVETHCSEPEDKVAESQYLRRVFRENGYPRNFVNRCMRKRDERQNRADPKFWRAIPYIKNVSEAVSRLLAPLGVGVAHKPEATMRRQVMRPKDPLPRQETSGVVYRIWCSCGQSNYVGETGRLLRTRIAEHVAAVRRNDANSQVAAHSTRPGHTFKFDEAEIFARGDNRVSRELLESWFTGPQSINKCNDIPIPYSVLRHRLAKAIDHSGRAQAGEQSSRRAIIMPASSTGDEITAINNLHAGHQAISAPACNNPR